MKNRRPFSVILAVVLVVWLPVTMLLYRTLGHRALQAYVVELRAKGEKLTFQELSASMSLPLDDSLIRLTNAVQSLGELPGGTTNIKVMQFVAPGRARVAWRLSTPPWIAESGGTWDTLSNQITQVAGALTELHEVANQPSRNAGYRTNYFAASPTPFRMVRAASAWLTCAALSYLHDGRKADALANIQSIAGLADLHREEYVLSSQMTRVAVATMGLGLTWEALQGSGWDDQQLREMQRCWEKIDLLDGLERGMQGERCSGMEFLRILRESKWRWQALPGSSASSTKKHDQQPAGENLGRLFLRTTTERDLLLMLRHAQSEVELSRSLRGDRPWSEVKESLNRLTGRLDKLSVSPTRFLYLFTLIALPNITPAFRTAARAETQRRLTITAIALRRYELVKGRRATNLESLVPEYLREVPRDCMSGDQLHYRLNADGTFRLYSAGDNGKDDGGQATVAEPGTNPGLWEGRDAVWPSVAVEENQQATALGWREGL